MIKDHYLVRRSEGSEVRQGKPNEYVSDFAALTPTDIYYDNLSIRNGIR